MLGGFLSTLVALAVGLVAGFITGFYFERRVFQRLRQVAQSVNKAVLSGGGQIATGPSVRATRDVSSAVAAWAVATQDASGRVDRNELIAHFVQEGADSRDVEAAVRALCDSGVAKQEGHWLQMT